MFSLPIHPRTGLQAIGIISGRPVWPVMGAEDTPPAPADPPKPTDPPAPAPTPPAPADPPKPTDPDDDKTDWKAEARKWEQRAKENRDKASKFDQAEAANKTELEKAQEAAQQATEKVKAAMDRAVRSEVRALADGFEDREDAVLRLGDLSRFVDDAGEINTKDIKAELKTVLEKASHLAKREEPQRRDPQRRPVPNLRPGGAPNEPRPQDQPVRLEQALQSHYQNS